MSRRYLAPERPLIEAKPHRFFMLHGWARWLASRLEPTLKAQEDLRVRRKSQHRVAGAGFSHDGRWGIMVNDDPLALEYQRLEFRLTRAKHAVGAPGLVGGASWGDGGFGRWDAEKVDAKNSETLAKLRARAVLARAAERERQAKGEYLPGAEPKEFDPVEAYGL